MLVPWNWATAWFPQFPSFQASPVLTVGLMLGTKPFGLWKHTQESAMGKPGLLCWVVFLVVPSYLSGNWSVSFLESWILANFYTVCLMTKACVSFLPLYYAFNFIRCIKFKYCVFTTFKLYYRRRKQLSVFPHSCSSFSVQVEINDMQPHPELVDQGELLSCLTGLYQTDFAGWKRSLKAPSYVTEVWCCTITGDLGQGGDNVNYLWAIRVHRLESWLLARHHLSCYSQLGAQSSSRQIKNETKPKPSLQDAKRVDRS